SSRRRHTRSYGDWSSDVCSSDLAGGPRRITSGARGARKSLPHLLAAYLWLRQTTRCSTRGGERSYPGVFRADFRAQRFPIRATGKRPLTFFSFGFAQAFHGERAL